MRSANKDPSEANGKLKRDDYDRELARLRVELVKLQQCVVHKGLKVVSRSGWFAARPSGTEAVYKIYAESFKDEAHLDAIVSEAQAMVNAALASSK